MPDDPPLDAGAVRVAEVVAALWLATDLGIGVPLFFLYAMASGFLHGVGRDAEHIVKHIASSTR